MNNYFSAIVLSAENGSAAVEFDGTAARALIPFSLASLPQAGDLVLCCDFGGQCAITAILERKDCDEQAVLCFPAKTEMRAADALGFVSGKIAESCVEKTVTVMDSRTKAGSMDSVCSEFAMDADLASQNSRILTSALGNSEECSTELASSSAGSSVTFVTGAKTEHAGRISVTSHGNATIDGKLIKLG